MTTKTINSQILEPYTYSFDLEKAGLVAITVSARCRSSHQTDIGFDENLRVELNGLQCRENSLQKYKQLFNVPSAFNGTKLKGLKKSVVFITMLSKGKHVLRLIPYKEAFVEKIEVTNLNLHSGNFLNFNLEVQAEDGNRRPWYVFVPIGFPLGQVCVEATVQKRPRDSDDIKIIIDGKTQKNIHANKFKYWYFIGGRLGWIINRVTGKNTKEKANFIVNLEQGIHYIEIFADRMPILHSVGMSFIYAQTEPEKRAARIIEDNAKIIVQAATEFQVDPIMVGAVIYQEQAENVNFIDTLTDYLGGVLHINTSIGVAQIRLDTAEALEKEYPSLDPNRIESIFIDYNTVRVERLKDPFTNIRYAAAKIQFSQNRWNAAGHDISDKPSIVGTLYNIEDVNHPIKPHGNPQPNNFGIGVGHSYPKVKILLQL